MTRREIRNEITADLSCFARRYRICIAAFWATVFAGGVSSEAALVTGVSSPNSITVTWTAPGDDGDSGRASQYDLRYSTSPITSANFSSAIAVSGLAAPRPAGTPESATINNLVPGTMYHVAIKVADEVPNWSGISNVASLSTSAEIIPPAAITDLVAIPGVDNGEIDLAWTAPGDDSLTGQATLYEIRYSTQLLTIANWDSATLFGSPPVPLASGATQTVTIGALIPAQLYYVGIKTYDDVANVSALSNVDSTEAKVNVATDIDDNKLELPDRFSLAQNYPNPFNPSTTIVYTLPVATFVRLDIFNIVGQLTAVLVNREQPAGSYEAVWSGTDRSASPVASGVYFYRLTTGEFVQSKRMVLIK